MIVCGVRVPVVRATADQIPDLAEDGRLLDGYFCSTQSVIFIRDGQSHTQERDTIVHEVAHAFLYLSGLGHRLEEVVGPALFERFEEGLVRMATPHLVAFILENGGKSWR